jgi:hypothetical protein
MTSDKQAKRIKEAFNAIYKDYDHDVHVIQNKDSYRIMLILLDYKDLNMNLRISDTFELLYCTGYLDFQMLRQVREYLRYN